MQRKTHKVKFLVNILSLALLLMAPVSPARPESGGEADFVYAKQAFTDGLYDLARERLESYIKNFPQTPYTQEAHALLGRSYYQLNNFTRSLYEFQIVLDAPEGREFQDEALYWVGEIYAATGDLRKSADYFEKVADGFPASKYHGFAVYSKGWASYKLGQLEEAMGCFDDVVEKYPLEKIAVDAQFRIGECAYLLGRYDTAELALGEYIEKYPVSEKTAEAYYLSGEAKFYLARYRESITAFERALAIAPKATWAPFAVYRTARALSRLGDHTASLAMYRACLDGAAGGLLASSCMLGMIESQEKLGAMGEALKLCDETIAKFPSGDAAAEAYYRKAKLLYGARSYAETEKACREAIGRFPGSPYTGEYRSELGWALAMQGRDDEALAEFAWIGRESKDIGLSSSALCKIGDIYFDRKDYAKAAESYDAVLDRYPDSSWADYAQYQIGTISLLTGRFDQAILAYRTVLVNFPNTGLREKVMAQLGTAYFKRGDFERAAAELEKYLADFPRGAAAETAKLSLATSLYNLSRYEDALAMAQQLAAGAGREDVRMMAAYQAGWCYYSMRKEREALDAFNGFLAAYPGSGMAVDVMFWFGEYYRARKEYERARGYFSVILQGRVADDMVREVMYQLAVTSMEEGKTDDAARRFEELAEKFPGTESAEAAYRKLARMKAGNKEFDGAIEYYRKVLTADNNESNAQVQYEIGEAYEKKGDVAQAAKEYAKVISLYGKGAFWAGKAQAKIGGPVSNNRN